MFARASNILALVALLIALAPAHAQAAPPPWCDKEVFNEIALKRRGLAAPSTTTNPSKIEPHLNANLEKVKEKIAPAPSSAPPSSRRLLGRLYEWGRPSARDRMEKVVEELNKNNLLRYRGAEAPAFERTLAVARNSSTKVDELPLARQVEELSNLDPPSFRKAMEEKIRRNWGKLTAVAGDEHLGQSGFLGANKATWISYRQFLRQHKGAFASLVRMGDATDIRVAEQIFEQHFGRALETYINGLRKGEGLGYKSELSALENLKYSGKLTDEERSAFFRSHPVAVEKFTDRIAALHVTTTRQLVEDAGYPRDIFLVIGNHEVPGVKNAAGVRAFVPELHSRYVEKLSSRYEQLSRELGTRGHEVKFHAPVARNPDHVSEIELNGRTVRVSHYLPDSPEHAAVNKGLNEVLGTAHPKFQGLQKSEQKLAPGNTQSADAHTAKFALHTNSNGESYTHLYGPSLSLDGRPGGMAYLIDPTGYVIPIGQSKKGGMEIAAENASLRLRAATEKNIRARVNDALGSLSENRKADQAPFPAYGPEIDRAMREKVRTLEGEIKEFAFARPIGAKSRDPEAWNAYLEKVKESEKQAQEVKAWLIRNVSDIRKEKSSDWVVADQVQAELARVERRIELLKKFGDDAAEVPPAPSSVEAVAKSGVSRASAANVRRTDGVFQTDMAGFFAGTFDPPHIGHKEAIRQAIAQGGLKEVLVLVRPPGFLKPNASDWALRIKMAEEFFSDIPEVRFASPALMDEMGRASYVDWVASLSEKNKSRTLYSVFGDDLLETGIFQNLQQKNVRYLMFARDSAGDRSRIRALADAAGVSGKYRILENHAPDVSSTYIRESIRAGRVPAEIDPRVAELYRHGQWKAPDYVHVTDGVLPPGDGPVVVFSGSFDPPHIGHLEALKRAMEKVGAKRAIVIPVAPKADKPNATPWPLRRKMAMISIGKVSGAHFPSAEFVEEMGAARYAQWIQNLAEKNPSTRFYSMTGEDLLGPKFQTYNLPNVDYLISGRGDRSLDDLLAAADASGIKGRYEVVLETGVPNSSTKQRAELAAGRVPEGLDPDILPIIKENFLFRNEEGRSLASTRSSATVVRDFDDWGDGAKGNYLRYSEALHEPTAGLSPNSYTARFLREQGQAEARLSDLTVNNREFAGLAERNKLSFEELKARVGECPGASTAPTCEEIFGSFTEAYARMDKSKRLQEKVQELSRLPIRGSISEIGGGHEFSSALSRNSEGRNLLSSVHSPYSSDASNLRYGRPPAPENGPSYTTKARLEQQLQREFALAPKREDRLSFVLTNTAQTSRENGKAWIGFKGELPNGREAEVKMQVQLLEGSSQQQKQSLALIQANLLKSVYSGKQDPALFVERLLDGLPPGAASVSHLDGESLGLSSRELVKSMGGDRAASQLVLYDAKAKSFLSADELQAKAVGAGSKEPIRLQGGRKVVARTADDFLAGKSAKGDDLIAITPAGQETRTLLDRTAFAERRAPSKVSEVDLGLPEIDRRVRELNLSRSVKMSVSTVGDDFALSERFFSQPMAPIFHSMHSRDDAALALRYGKDLPPPGAERLHQQMVTEFDSIVARRPQRKFGLANQLDEESGIAYLGLRAEAKPMSLPDDFLYRVKLKDLDPETAREVMADLSVNLAHSAFKNQEDLARLEGEALKSRLIAGAAVDSSKVEVEKINVEQLSRLGRSNDTRVRHDVQLSAQEIRNAVRLAAGDKKSRAAVLSRIQDQATRRALAERVSERTGKKLGQSAALKQAIAEDFWFVPRVREELFRVFREEYRANEAIAREFAVKDLARPSSPIRAAMKRFGIGVEEERLAEGYSEALSRFPGAEKISVAGRRDVLRQHGWQDDQIERCLASGLCGDTWRAREMAATEPAIAPVRKVASRELASTPPFRASSTYVKEIKPLTVARDSELYSEQQIKNASAPLKAASLFRSKVERDLSDLRRRVLNGEISLTEFEQRAKPFRRLDASVAAKVENVNVMDLLSDEEKLLAQRLTLANAELKAARAARDSEAISRFSLEEAKLRAEHAAVSARWIGEEMARSREIASSQAAAREARRRTVLGFDESFYAPYRDQFGGRTFQEVAKDSASAKRLRALVARDLVSSRRAPAEARASLERAVGARFTQASRSEVKQLSDDLAEAMATGALKKRPRDRGQAMVDALRAKGWSREQMQDCGALCLPGLPPTSARARAIEPSALAHEVLLENELLHAAGPGAEQAKRLASPRSAFENLAEQKPYELLKTTLEEKQTTLKAEENLLHRRLEAAVRGLEGRPDGSAPPKVVEELTEAHAAVKKARELLDGRVDVVRQESVALQDIRPLTPEELRLNDTAMAATLDYLRQPPAFRLGKIDPSVESVAGQLRKGEVNSFQAAQELRKATARLEPEANASMARQIRDFASNKKEYAALLSGSAKEGEVAEALRRAHRVKASAGHSDPEVTRAVYRQSGLKPADQAIADAVGGAGEASAKGPREVQLEKRALIAKADAEVEKIAKADLPPAPTASPANRKLASVKTPREQFEDALAGLDEATRKSVMESAEIVERGRSEVEMMALAQKFVAASADQRETMREVYKNMAEIMGKGEKREAALSYGVRKMLKDLGFSPSEINGTPSPGLFQRTIACFEL